MNEPYSCPFCPLVVTDQVIVIPALRLFELHLDGHMARGDAQPAPAAALARAS